MSQENLEHEGSCPLLSPDPLKPRESLRNTSFCIMAFKSFPVIKTFTFVEYDTKGKALFWLLPSE